MESFTKKIFYKNAFALAIKINKNYFFKKFYLILCLNSNST